MVHFSSTWQKQESPPALESQAIHVWGANIGELAQNQLLYKTFLNASELTRAEKYVFEYDRERFISVRGFLRQLLGQYLQIDPKQLIFDYAEHGKPEVRNNQNALDLNFNLSDSRELVLIALGKKQSLGVDVEFVRENLDILGMAKSFFSAHEYQTLITTAPEHQHEFFFHIWTRKEALIKNIGLGLYYPVEKIEALGDTTVDNATGIEYRIFSLPIAENYQAALATAKNMSEEDISYLMWSNDIH
jgi:4'-phosphopantetheinyl transferase